VRQLAVQLPGHVLMDTIGPHALVLPDAQVHFHGLDEGRVAGPLPDLTRSSRPPERRWNQSVQSTIRCALLLLTARHEL